MANGFSAPTGYVLWEGASPEDGSPIVAILTLRSSNSKTGNIPQVWILRADMHPSHAVATGWDQSICGQCLHRRQPDGTRSCYVRVSEAPAAVWKTYRRGRYPSAWESPASVAALQRGIRDRAIRWGAYGDPAMIPEHIVSRTQALTSGGWRGYTHQWRKTYAAWARGRFMASVDGLLEYLDADAAGWQTFHVVPRGHRPEQGRQCPATVPGSVAQCRSCTQCDGRHGHIWVEAHGSGAAYVTA